MEAAVQNIYQLRVALRHISPLVWRRVLIPDDSSLADLHEVLQIVFDWDGSRLHAFRIHGKEYSSQDNDPRSVMLKTLRLQAGERFLYEYNFCAGWQCDVRLESTRPHEAKRWYPVCTGGRGPSPPEICSGPLDYLERLERFRFGPSFEELEDLNTLAEAVRELLDKPSKMTCQEFLEKHEIEDAVERMTFFEGLRLKPFLRRPINKKLRDKHEEAKRENEDTGGNDL